MSKIVFRISQEWPGKVKIFTIGQSVEGRDIKLALVLYFECLKFVFRMSQEWPGKVKIFTIGQSVEGRDIKLARIGSRSGHGLD
jgi:hypothetical protein